MFWKGATSIFLENTTGILTVSGRNAAKTWSTFLRSTDFLMSFYPSINYLVFTFWLLPFAFQKKKKTTTYKILLLLSQCFWFFLIPQSFKPLSTFFLLLATGPSPFPTHDPFSLSSTVSRGLTEAKWNSFFHNEDRQQGSGSRVRR